MKDKTLIVTLSILWTLLISISAGVTTNWTRTPGTSGEIVLWGGLYAAGFLAMGGLAKRRADRINKS